MKPFSAGILLRVDGEPTSISPLQCLDFVLAQPVATVVPGVKNADELRASLAFHSAPSAERDHRQALPAIYKELAGHCTHCRKCMPCLRGIPITTVIAIAGWARGGVQDWLRGMYEALPAKPSACDGCGACEEACAFDVDIVGVMRQVDELFES
jgi:predicted aldo/keto reductase-like oxidoreductase